MRQIVDIVWDGFTLKHVSDKRFIFPYLLFLSFLFLFQGYLLAVLFLARELLLGIGYRPAFSFYGISLFLIMSAIYTVTVFYETIRKKYKNSPS